jgi:single-strand DNA-binding protein
MMNHVVLIGRLGADPEIRYTQGGVAIANLRLATSKSWKNEAGEWQEKATWHKVTAFKRLAEKVEQLRKGDLITVVGEISVDQWEDKTTGQARTQVKIIADKILRAGVLKLEGQGGPQKDELNQENTFTEDDIPF